MIAWRVPSIGNGLLAALILLFGVAGMSGRAPGQVLSADEPIEINADSLQVRREERLAVFSGNVDAVQGKLRLKADQLKVHYRESGDTTDGAAVQGAISRLDAEGNVFVSSPRETARGERGVYDVVDQRITLTGDVVLTRGQNVLRGGRLVMNLETGVTTLDGTAAQGGRVRGLFMPESEE